MSKTYISVLSNARSIVTKLLGLCVAGLLLNGCASKTMPLTQKLVTDHDLGKAELISPDGLQLFLSHKIFLIERSEGGEFKIENHRDVMKGEISKLNGFQAGQGVLTDGNQITVSFDKLNPDLTLSFAYSEKENRYFLAANEWENGGIYSVDNIEGENADYYFDGIPLADDYVTLKDSRSFTRGTLECNGKQYLVLFETTKGRPYLLYDEPRLRRRVPISDKYEDYSLWRYLTGSK